MRVTSPAFRPGLLIWHWPSDAPAMVYGLSAPKGRLRLLGDDDRLFVADATDCSAIIDAAVPAAYEEETTLQAEARKVQKGGQP
jgi:hypothetical protein